MVAFALIPLRAATDDGVNLVPATPLAPLPPSATEPPSGKAVAAVPSTVPVGAVPADPVKAGAAVVDATWRVGASAGQYAGDPVVDGADSGDPAAVLAGLDPEDPHTLAVRRSPSYGIQSRMSVRALVVEGPDGTRVAMVTNDLYIPQDLVNERVAGILAEHDRLVTLGLLDEPLVGIDHANMAISVSHSHSSPYYSALAWGLFAFQDVFDLRFFEYIAQRMATAVIQASATMKPVRMAAASAPFDHTQRHSFGPSVGDDGTPAGYPQRDNDLALTVLRFDDISDPARPKILANYVTLGQHPEMLEGNNLLSGEFVQAAVNLADRATGGVTLLAQNNTGTSEPDSDGRSHAPAVRAEFSHREYAQMERGARQIANAIVDTSNRIGTGRPPVPAAAVPYRADFPVAVSDRQFAPPLSHPFPTVSNCRTHEAFAGNPGVPIVGLPDCERAFGDVTGPVVGELEGTPLDPGVTFDELQGAGVPLPENYGAPGYSGVQETLQVHLQVFRFGEVVLTFCPCEQWADQSRNVKSRADKVQDNQWLGWDWTDYCTRTGEGWTCPDPGAVASWKGDPRSPARTLEITDAEYRRIEAQVNNDAAGWDEPENLLAAESEPEDPEEIWGNYTHTELDAEHGYGLVVPVGMTNDYFGYIATYREYQRGDHYRKALTALGPHSSDWFATRLVAMAGSLKGDPASIAKIEYGPQDLLYMVDGAHQAARAELLGQAANAYLPVYEATLPPDAGEAAAVAQPSDVKRFDVAQFSWRGGSNYTDTPSVRVEREVAPGQWQTAGDMTGDVVVTVDYPDGLEEYVVDFRSGSFEWVWTAHWEVFNSDVDLAYGNSTPTGRYRFVVDGQRREGIPAAVVAYEVTSAPFTVSAWDGITVTDVKAEPDGSVSFAVGPRNTKKFSPRYPGGDLDREATAGPIDYPDTWPEAKLPTEAETGSTVFPRLERTLIDGAHRYCFSCTFRPWADTGSVAAATVTVTRADGQVVEVPATVGSDGRLRTAAAVLGAGDRAVVAAGAVRDQFGEKNPAPSASVLGTGVGQLPSTGAVPDGAGIGAVVLALALVVRRRLSLR